VNVLLLTIFVSAVLVLFFVALFLLQGGCIRERDALLPLADEDLLPPANPPAVAPPTHHS
jgi:hypothetical protein